MALTPSLLSKKYFGQTQTSLPIIGPNSFSYGGSFGFDPRAIPGCMLWLDSQNSNNVTTSSGNVTSWKDLSVHTLGNVVGTSGSYPTYSNNSISFSGSQYLSGSAATVGNLGTYDFAIFAVVKVPATLTTNQYILSKYTSASIHWELYYNISGQFIFKYTWAAGNRIVAVNNTAVGNYVVVSVIAPRTITNGMQIYINGTVSPLSPATGSPVTISTTGNLYIGCQMSTSLGNYLTSSIGEILMYSANADGNATTTDISNGVSNYQQQQIEGYLANKWGITITGLYVSSKPFLMPFRPPDIPNCVLWLDAADTSSIVITSGTTNAIRWKDKSLSGNDAIQLSGAKAPTYVNTPSIPSTNGVLFSQLNAIGNLPADSMILDIPTLSSSYTDAKYRHVFIVFTPTVFKGSNNNASRNASTLLGTNGTASPGGIHGNTLGLSGSFTYSSTTTYLDSIQINSGSSVITTLSPAGPININTQYLISSEVSTTAINSHLNGSRVLSGSTGGTSTVTCNARLAATFITPQTPHNVHYYEYDGYISEVIIYQSSSIGITNLQRQQVEGYLSWKWGLQLTTTHPFTKFPSATVGPYPDPGT